MPKNYNNTFLYNKFPRYDEMIYSFLMDSIRIDPKDERFEDIRYEFKKRQVNNCLIKVLDSKNVILLKSDDNSLPKHFRIFCGKDPKTKSSDYKIFVDCTDIIKIDDRSGMYQCRYVDILIADMINAMVTLIYHKAPDRILTNTIMTQSMQAFASLFTYIVDYVAHISVVPTAKDKCQYLACVFYTKCILERDFDDNFKHMAGKLVSLSNREQEMIMIQVKDSMFENIKTFVDGLSDILKINDLKIDNIVDRWMFIYGVNTIFGLEYFPALSTMITDAYIGAYMNNQKTIEKVLGNSVIIYSKNIIERGSTMV